VRFSCGAFAERRAVPPNTALTRVRTASLQWHKDKGARPSPPASRPARSPVYGFSAEPRPLALSASPSLDRGPRVPSPKGWAPTGGESARGTHPHTRRASSPDDEARARIHPVALARHRVCDLEHLFTAGGVKRRRSLSRHREAAGLGWSRADVVVKAELVQPVGRLGRAGRRHHLQLAAFRAAEAAAAAGRLLLSAQLLLPPAKRLDDLARLSAALLQPLAERLDDAPRLWRGAGQWAGGSIRSISGGRPSSLCPLLSQ